MLFCSLLYIFLGFISESYTLWRYSLLLMDFFFFFFVYVFVNVKLKRTLSIIIPSLLHLVSLCVAVSLILVPFFFFSFFLKVGIGFFFLPFFFWICSARNGKYLYHTLDWGERYSSCIFEIGVMCNKRWRWVVYFNPTSLEDSMNFCPFLHWCAVNGKSAPGFGLRFKVSAGVEDNKIKPFHRQTHTHSC